MKLFFYLFSLYILVLAGIPCQADDDCCVDEIAMNAAHSPVNKTDKHPGYPGPCSPFFACGACHGFVVPTFGLTLCISWPVEAMPQAIYKSQALPDFHAIIWQPPKPRLV
jgi:hypothetical protein